MKTVFVFGLLLLAGAMAQDAPAAAPAAACDPALAGTELLDLQDTIGALSCKVPASVNLGEVLQKLTGTLNGLNVEQLRKLPELIGAVIAVNPAALQPLFALSAKELNTVLPLLTDVSADTLKVVFPLLAEQPEGTVDKLVKFLSLISSEQLQRVSPALNRITQGQLNVLLKALNTLPAQSWDALIKLVQGLGPVTDAVVSVHQQVGALPSSTGTKQQAGGRKLLQTPEETAAAEAAGAAAAAQTTPTEEASAASAAAPAGPAPVGRCKTAEDVSAAGLEVGAGLLTDFGPVVCKFTAAELRPVMSELLTILTQQSEETLGNLPAFTDSLTRLDPAAFEAFFKVPAATLKALIPVLEGLDQKVVTAQLKALGGLSAEDVKKMVYFLNNTDLDRIQILIPFFSKLTTEQVTTMAKLLNSLSPGQIVLAIHLLDRFGFAVDAIGQRIAASNTTGSSFMIGPIKVTMANSTSQTSRPSGFASWFRHPFFGSFFG